MKLTIEVEGESWEEVAEEARRMAERASEYRTAPIIWDRSGPYVELSGRGDGALSGRMVVTVPGEHAEER